MSARQSPAASFAGKRCFFTALLAGVLWLPSSLHACELDGLSHGYGPLSAMFAGAHRYQSLNGTDEAAEETPAPQAEVQAAVANPASAAPAPRRSFVTWVKAKPKAQPGEPPAVWSRSLNPPAHTNTSTAPKPPRGGPTP